MTDHSELTRWIAENVMWWKWVEPSVWVNYSTANSQCGCWEGNGRYAAGLHWNPTESIHDAWMVVEKMGGLDLIKVDDGWMVGDGSSGYSDDDGAVEMKLRNFAIAATAPLAICLAAKAAIESATPSLDQRASDRDQAD